MKIKNIKINSYGNLENKDINLENKINIIYGKNESGKSTLLNFIKNIFYGISKNKNGKEISDYDKFVPWNKEDFSGKIKYELDNGENFEVYRDFHKKNPMVLNGKFEDISKDFKIDKKDGTKFFEEQTNVDENTFLSTIVSMQNEVRLDKKDAELLVQRIANLAGTGDDNVSFNKTIDKLTKKALEEVGSDRTTGRPINIVKNRIKDIMFVIKDTKSYEERKKELETQKEELEKTNISLEIKNNIFKELNEINLETNLQKEKINLKKQIENQIQKKIDELNIEKNKLTENIKENYSEIEEEKNKNKEKENKIKNKKSKNKIKYFLISILFIILFLIIQFINIKYFKNNYLNIFSFLLIPIYFIILLITRNKNKKIKYEEKINIKMEEEKIKNEKNIINTKIEIIDKQLKQYIEEKEKNSNEIKNIKLEIDKKLDEIIEKIKEEYKNKINIEKILDEIDFNNVKNQLELVQEKLNQNKLQLNSLLLEEKNIILKLDNMIELKEEYKSLEEKLQDLEEKNKCILLTKDYLNRAYEKMKTEVTPKFTQNLSKNMADISNNKYTNVRLNDEKGLIVENDLGQYISIENLSVGTIDQLYLSLRLSMIDDITNEKMPIILDETFAYYDDTRLENILKYLIEKSKERQIIIFTCTQREKQILQKMQIEYNLVEL